MHCRILQWICEAHLHQAFKLEPQLSVCIIKHNLAKQTNQLT